MEYGLVLGAPRSGTTFLMQFLDAMPATEAVTGNLLPTVVPHLVNQELSPLAHSALQGALEKSVRDYLESGLFNARSAALRKWAASREGLWPALRGRRSVARVVYKEPFLAFAPGYAFDALPDARLVYILRDGRDVADSLVRSYDVLSDDKLSRLDSTEAPIGRKVDRRYVPWWVEEGRETEFLGLAPFARALWMWAEMVGRCRAYFAAEPVRNSGRVLEIRYEELVADPQREGKRVAAHLGGPMTGRMRSRIGSAHARSVGVHRGRSAAELAEGERIAGDTLRACGYG